MNRIEQEKITVCQMIKIYCKGHKHSDSGLCQDCTTLLNYAYFRLDHCKYGEKKSTCKVCPTHCYNPDMREKMRQAMRYAGPRMIWHHPISALKHIFREFGK